MKLVDGLQIGRILPESLRNLITRIYRFKLQSIDALWWNSRSDWNSRRIREIRWMISIHRAVAIFGSFFGRQRAERAEGACGASGVRMRRNFCCPRPAMCLAVIDVDILDAKLAKTAEQSAGNGTNSIKGSAKLDDVYCSSPLHFHCVSLPKFDWFSLNHNSASIQVNSSFILLNFLPKSCQFQWRIWWLVSSPFATWFNLSSISIDICSVLCFHFEFH